MNPKWKRRNPNTPARRARRKAAAAVLAVAQAQAAPKTYKASGKLGRTIKAVLNSAIETKFVADITIQASVVGQSAATPGAFFKLIPRLTQGLQENQRVGDKVKPIKILNKFCFHWDPTTQNNQDCFVNLWLVRVKGAGTPGAVNAVYPGNFLKIGNGGNTDPNDPNQPNMLQIISAHPLNTEQYTLIKHYRFRMRRGIGVATNTNTGGEVAPTGVGNIEMSKYITHKMTAPAFKYNSNADLLPENFYPVWLTYATNADGTAYGDGLRVSCVSQMYYKDA